MKWFRSFHLTTSQNGISVHSILPHLGVANLSLVMLGDTSGTYFVSSVPKATLLATSPPKCQQTWYFFDWFVFIWNVFVLFCSTLLISFPRKLISCIQFTKAKIFFWWRLFVWKKVESFRNLILMQKKSFLVKITKPWGTNSDRIKMVVIGQ